MMTRIRNLCFLLAVCTLVVMTTTKDSRADYKDKLSSIKSAVESDPNIGPHEIDVYYRLGDVIVKGTVNSERARDRVVEIAKNTKGVKSVTNWITITPNYHSEQVALNEPGAIRHDTELASDIRTAISTDNKSLSNKVNVAVNNGNATLRGDVRSFRDVDQAISTALMVNGVRDVSSELTINGRPYAVQKFIR